MKKSETIIHPDILIIINQFYEKTGINLLDNLLEKCPRNDLWLSSDKKPKSNNLIYPNIGQIGSFNSAPNSQNNSYSIFHSI